MNYLKQTEKFLKTSLKGKVNLTTGVMVAFLLTGNLSFAATEITNATKVPITQGGEYILGQDSITLEVNNGLVVNGGNVKIDVGNNQSLTLNNSNSSNNSNGAIGYGTITGNGSLILKGRTGIGVGTQNISTQNFSIEASDYGINGYGQTSISSNNVNISSKGGYGKAIYIPHENGTGDGTVKISNFKTLNIYSSNYAIQNQGINTKVDNQVEIIGSENSSINIKTEQYAIMNHMSNISKTKLQAGTINLYSAGKNNESILHVDSGEVRIDADNLLITKVSGFDSALNPTGQVANYGYSLLYAGESGKIYINENNYDKNVQINGSVVNKGFTEINLGTKDSYLTGIVTTSGKGVTNIGLYNGATWNTRGDSIVTELTLNGGKINNNYNIKVSEPIEMLGSSNGYNSILTGSGSYSKIGTGNLVEISNQGNEFNLSSGANFNGDIVVNEGASLLNKGVFSVNGKVENSGTITLNSGTTINLKADSSFTNKEGATLVVNSGATAVTGGSATNNGIIILENTQNDSELSKLVNNSKLTSEGTIKLNDYSQEKLSKEEREALLNKLTVNGTVDITGTIVNSKGDALYLAGIEVSGDENTVGSIIGKTENEDIIKVEEDNTIISGSQDKDGNSHILEDKVINVGGDLTFKPHDKDKTGVILDKVTINVTNDKNITTIGENHIFNNTSINLIGNSNLVIGSGSESTSLEINGGIITTDENTSFIQTAIDSSLTLKGTTVGVDITGDGNLITHNNTFLNGNVMANKVEILGGTQASGNIIFKELVIGKLKSTENHLKQLILSSKANLGIKNEASTFSNERSDSTSITIAKDGQLVLEVDKDGNTALSDSVTTITYEGDSHIPSKVDILFYLADETVGEKLAITISKDCKFEEGLIFGIDSEIYVLYGNVNDGFYAVYNQQLTDIYKELNDLNKLAVYAGEYLSLNKDTRITQLDKLYTSSIYSETVKAAYDGIKASEEVILNLGTPITVGEWTSIGAALYNKSDYDKKGVIGESYNTTTDTSGLLGAMEYGISDTASIGFVFSGAKQSVDSIGGSADGTLLYLGAYSRKEMGNHLFTTGIGYQFANYDAKNSAGSLSTSNKYSSNALSLYGKAVYSFNFENNITLQPKVKIGYTYIDQEDATDNYFTVKDANISSFDMEIGTDLIKTVAISDGKVDLALGVSYIRVMGDTDKEFKGGFVGKDGTTKILGAQLAENTGKVNFDVTVSKDNGFNYNAGVYMKAGSDKNRSYGATVGIGYKF